MLHFRCYIYSCLVYIDVSWQFITTLIQYTPSLIILVIISFKFYNEKNDSYSIRKETILNCTVGMISSVVFSGLNVLLSLTCQIGDSRSNYNTKNKFLTKMSDYLIEENLVDYLCFVCLSLLSIITLTHYLIITAWVLMKKKKFEQYSQILFQDKHNNIHAPNNNNNNDNNKNNKKNNRSVAQSESMSNQQASAIKLKFSGKTNPTHNTIGGKLIPLREILSDEIGFQLFAAFCVGEFSVESLLFLFHLSQIKYLLLQYELS